MKASSAHWGYLCKQSAEVSRRISLLGFEMSIVTHGGQLLFLCGAENEFSF